MVKQGRFGFVFFILGATSLIVVLAAILAYQIRELSTKSATSDAHVRLFAQVDTSFENTRHFDRLASTSGDSTQRLSDISDHLSKLHSNGKTTADMTKEVRLMTEKLTEPKWTYVTKLAKSCWEIKKRLPNSKSGMYQISMDKTDYPWCYRYVYCHMGELCGVDDGWTRIAFLNMSAHKAICPCGFRQFQSSGVNVCGRPENSGPGCASTTFLSYGMTYDEVCGRVTGYQYGAPDADEPPLRDDMNSHYIDGISITSIRNLPGQPTSRTHVWSLMGDNGDNHCPCNTGRKSDPTTASFVGDDYYCEAGVKGINNWAAGTLYTDDPLWDGQGCDSPETACCNRPGIPWFHTGVYRRSTDNLELRVCADQGVDIEDVPFSFYDIYVK